MAEIDDKELETLRTAAKFIEMVEGAEGGRSQIEKWAKKLNPKVRTTDDVAEEYTKPLKDDISALKDWKDGMDKKISDYNVSESFAKVRKDYGYTDDGEKVLKKFMEDNGIKNPEIAAAAYEKMNPSAPIRPSYLSDEFTLSDLTGQEGKKDEEIEKIIKNPLKFQDDETRKFFQEREKKTNLWGEQ